MSKDLEATAFYNKDTNRIYERYMDQETKYISYWII